MDRPDASAEELATAFRNLRLLNRWFGSYALVLHFVRRWAPGGGATRILDLATGSADIPRRIVDDARRRGACVEIVAVDFQATTIDLARKASAAYPEIRCERADILEFEAGEPFDIVLCSLALHHFSDHDAVRVLQRCRELTRRYVLVSDLRRGFLLRAGVGFLAACYLRDHMTREDARASAARAFSMQEMQDLARRAGWENFGAGRFRFGRQAIWLDGEQSRS